MEEDALVPDFLDEKRDEIDNRLAELRPLIAEYNRLQAASAALAEVAGSSGALAAVGIAGSASDDLEGAAAAARAADASALGSAPVRRGPGRPRGSGSGGGGSRVAADGEDVDGGFNGDGDGDGDETVLAGDDAAAAGIQSDRPSLPGPRPRPPLPRPTPRPSSGPRRAGRPKGSGQRAAEALRVVREQPGVTIPELADRMGIKQNYLYRVLPELVQEGKVVKQGRGWHPRAA